MRSGFVAILGRPNVGKSTLLNGLLSKKVSIVSPRAQTTRDAVLGILNEKDKQIVFVDTPGIFYGDGKLESHMRRAAFGSAHQVDAILYLIDVSDPESEADLKILSSIDSEAPRFLVFNKIDRVHVEEARAKEAIFHEAFPDFPIIETSLLENFGFREIRDAIDPFIQEGMPFYPQDSLTDKDKAYQAKEVVREELLRFLKQEVPHQSAVKIDSFLKKEGGYEIRGRIIVDKEAHKSIVIGKNGQMIKKISMSARHELERMWHDHITVLTIRVEAIPGWRNSPKLLAELGYGD
ncbi:MAG: GTPase Era [Bacilli bacterium]|nr:GTPase Era [Bacilli bacterium]